MSVRGGTFILGIYDSSRTRVTPFFNWLFDHDPTGGTWLGSLMRLGSDGDKANLPDKIGCFSSGHPRWWGKNERRLRPPESLLKWLVQNISAEAVSRSGDEGEVLRKRQLLSQRDPATTAEAHSLIERGQKGRWFKLEGKSCPDAYFETRHILLVIEGKRKERKCTTRTKWMDRRSQLVRHMDAALEVAGDRRVFGMLIVEPTDETPEKRPSKFWLDQLEQQRSDEMLGSTLPHRTPEQRALLKNGILGVTTWQRACRVLKVPWPLE